MARRNLVHAIFMILVCADPVGVIDVFNVVVRPTNSSNQVSSTRIRNLSNVVESVLR